MLKNEKQMHLTKILLTSIKKHYSSDLVFFDMNSSTISPYSIFSKIPFSSAIIAGQNNHSQNRAKSKLRNKDKGDLLCLLVISNLNAHMQWHDVNRICSSSSRRPPRGSAACRRSTSGLPSLLHNV